MCAEEELKARATRLAVGPSQRAMPERLAVAEEAGRLVHELPLPGQGLEPARSVVAKVE
jgi:hypothetical protein